MDFYLLSREETLQELQSADNGLMKEEVNRRLEKHGYNELKDQEKGAGMEAFLRDI